MSQIPQRSVYCIVVCAILLLSSIGQSKEKLLQPPSETHYTVVNFFHKENDRPLFYWVILDAEYQSDNFTTAMEPLVTGIEAVKTFIDAYKAEKSVKESQRLKLVLSQNLENVNEFVSAANSYRFKLSEMQIDFRKNFILDQKIIIRVKDDRKELAHFIDQLRETVLASNKELNLLGINRASNQKFYQNAKYPNDKMSPEGQSLIESEEFTQKVVSKAQSHCQSLQMSLGQILSTKQLIFQQLRNKTLQNITEADTENFEEMDYFDAYEKKDYSESDQFVYRLFEVKAKCTGNRPLKESRVKNKGQKEDKIQQHEPMTGEDLEEMVKKYKKQKIIIN